MSKIALTPNASGTGTLTVAAPNTNTDYTLTLPTATTTLVGTDATQTLTNKTIASSQLTGALPAIDGSALTGIASMTLLGTIATTSGSSVTLSGLTLTSYKQLQFVYNSVSGTSTNALFRLNGVQVNAANTAAATDFCSGGGTIDLTSGVFWGSGLQSYTGGPSFLATGGASGLTTASTSISFTISAGTFDAGSILIYGVK
jgi:hypothetical protein